jgi:hypothetical protein
MFCAGTVADLAACILEVGCFLETDKAPRLPIACGVAGITLPDFVRGKVPHLLLNTLKRGAFFGIGHEIVILLRVTVPACQ